MISKNKLVAMLELQAKLNSKINPDWAGAGYPWHRAIMVEGVEALEHYGWKWWKKQEPDLTQVKIELVDIWHFALSMALQARISTVDEVADRLISRFVAAEMHNSHASYSTAAKFDALISAAGDGMFSAAAFHALMKDFELSWHDLYAIYVAKNVLNMFRQDNGYKEGTYVKDWNGVEDNVALDQLLTLKPDATPGQLYAKLEQVYAGVVLATFGE